MRRLVAAAAVLALTLAAACGGGDGEAEAAFDEAFDLYNAGQWAQAIPAFDRVIEAQPDRALAYAYRGVSRWNLGHDAGDKQQIEQSIVDLDRALELDSSSFIALLHRGLAYYDLGRYSEAIAQFEDAQGRADNPTSQLELVYYRGITLRELGDIDGARDALETAIQIAQAGDLRDRIQKALDSLDTAN